MRHGEKLDRRFLAAGLAASVLLASAALPRPAAAFTRGWSGSVYYYDSFDARRLQQDAQSDAAEQRREVAREKRRDEIAKEKTQSEQEYLASQAEIRQSSRAAANAPREYFYRKPGTFAKTLPGATVEMKVGNETYHYFSGIFYRQLPDGYIVVPAPLGAVVDKLPEGAGGAVYKGDSNTYFYYFGTFFTAEGDKYKTVKPPAGTLVGYVPDGYTETEVDGGPRYEFGGFSFKPVFMQDVLVYQVAKG